MTASSPASMGEPLSEADRLRAEIRRTLKMAKMASANAPGTFWHTFTQNTEFLLELVGVLEGQLATARAELEQQRYYGEQLQMSIEACSGNHDDALGLDGGGSGE